MDIYGHIQQGMHGHQKFDARDSHASPSWGHPAGQVHRKLDQETGQRHG